MAFEVDVENIEKVIHGFDTSEAINVSGIPDWLLARRTDAQKNLEQVVFPTPEEEIWRYSRVDALLSIGLTTTREVPKLSKVNRLPDDFPKEIVPLGDIAEIVLVLSPGKLTIYERNGSNPSVSVSLAKDVNDRSWPDTKLSSDFFTLFGEAFGEDTYVIDIAPEFQLDAPILVVVTAETERQAYFPQVILNAGTGSKSRLIEIFAGGTPSTLIAGTTQIHLAERAKVEHFQIQYLVPGAFHIANVDTYLQSDADFEYGAFSFGGHYARVRCENHLLGQKAKAILKAAYFADGDQMLDFRTLQDHRSPNTFSDLLFKGAVAGNSHSVYSGLVRIEEGAYRSDAFQTNRNLVLSEGARADSVPNLDIRENNVRCSHASAVGPIDPELIFYLESRGIDPKNGEQMIVRGFFNEILENMGSSETTALIGALVDKKLEGLKK